MTASIPSGVVLFQYGDPVSAVYLIRSGILSIEIAQGARTTPLIQMTAGAIAGLPAVLNGVHSLTGRVTEACEVGYVPANQVRDLLEWDSHLCLAAMRLVNEELLRLRRLCAPLPYPEPPGKWTRSIA